MLVYCLKQKKQKNKKKTGSKNPKVVKVNKWRIMPLAVIVKINQKEETNRLLTNLELRAPLSKIPILSENLF